MRHIAGVFHLLIELPLGDEFIKAGVREKDKAVFAPGLGAHAGRLGAARDLQRADAPGFLQFVFVQGGVGADTDKAVELEQIARLEGGAVAAAAVFGRQNAVQHARAHAKQRFEAVALFPAEHVEAAGRPIQYAGHAEKQVHAVFGRLLVACAHLLAEGHLARFPHRGHKAQVDLRADEVGEHAGRIGHRGQAVQHAAARAHMEVPGTAAGGQQHGRQNVRFVGFEHALGVGRALGGEVAAFPGRVQPDDRFGGQHILPLGQQHIGVVLKTGQRHAGAEFLNGGRGIPLEKALAQGAAGHQLYLFHQQPLLNVHIFRQRQRQKAAILLPDFGRRAALELFFKRHLLHGGVIPSDRFVFRLI